MSESNHTFRPGALLGFSNRGCPGVVINLTTWGIPGRGLSHVALVGRHPETKDLVLWESLYTSPGPCLVQGKAVSGVQVQPIERRIERYNGHVWHYPLVVRLTAEQLFRLDTYCLESLGLDYDELGAIRSRGLSIIERLVFRPQDLTSVFCSEFAAGAHQVVGVTNDALNASRQNPNRLMRRERRMGVLCKPVQLK